MNLVANSLPVVGFGVPWGFITKSCKQQAEVIQNHENAIVRYIGQGEARHRN
jgi:hypothetical protein